jgi:hypothetical protein
MAPRKKPAPKKLPKANVPDPTSVRQDIDYTSTNERVSHLDAHVTDHGKRIAQVEGSADYWSGVSERVKKLEDEKATPTTTIVEQASGMAIAWCFLINDLLVGAAIGGWYVYEFGVPSWVPWTH